MAERRPVVLKPGEGRAYDMGDRMSAVFKADRDETAHHYSISEWWLEPHTKGPPAHQHPEDDVFFIIGGTGAGHDSAKSYGMANVLYRAGFHVVTLPSPTHSSFIVTASSTSIPGQLALDAQDLYRVMGLIATALAGEIDASGYYVGGYSLGGTHTAVERACTDERCNRQRNQPDAAGVEAHLAHVTPVL